MKIILQYCLALIFGLNNLQAQQFNQLADAVIKKDTIKIQQQLQSGIDINTQHPTSGTTVLMIASSYYYYDDIVNFLIIKGANVHEDKDGKTALLWASSNSLENAKILISNGAKVNEAANDGMTPFLQATLGVIIW